jgi:predicted ATP-binding protein involved in virulence
MKIKEISIEGLFGIFDHVIPLNMDERITMIHSPNGYGKTTVLRLLKALFSSRNDEFYKTPYKTFSVIFDDNSCLKVEKTLNDSHPILSFCFSGNGNQEHFSFGSDKKSEKNSKLVNEYLPTLEKKDLEVNILKKKNVTAQIPIYLVESQRLINIAGLGQGEDIAVEELAKELARKIDTSLAQYAAISQALDRTFPVRMISQKSPSDFTKDYLRDKFAELEKSRERLIDIGLLDDTEESPPQIQTEIDKSLIEDITKGILAVYIEDTEKKLDVLSNIADKIVVFKRIINSWFKYKKLEIDKKEGFFFVTDSGDRLSPRDLSSGEQHELIMLYELLFQAEAGSLILIDEPEISLHVGWQSQFLQELLEITKLADIDVLMATHSPDIIQDRWDLTVELKGK